MFKLPNDNKFLVAVSGGPDSMFLLVNLLKQNIKNIIVCHVNYNFREDSNIDQVIVENFCLKNNLDLRIKETPQETYENFEENFESWARKIRYDFFCEVSEETGIDQVLVAHNENDLIETYIMQKLRKSIITHFGLKTISEYKNIKIIRPMLKLKKTEILTYLKENNIEYALDSTNENTKYLRNEVRKNLSENQFEEIKKEIEALNEKTYSKVNEAIFYANNNLTEKQLIISNQLREHDLDMIQMTIFEFFKNIRQDHLVNNRDNKTIFEIAKRIKESEKSFWSIKVKDKVIIKDFDRLYILEENDVSPVTHLINSKKDLEKIKYLSNYVDLYNAIERTKFEFPYIVSTDFEKYKLETRYKNKKTNRFLIDNKIPYKNRFFKAVVYNKYKKKILNNIK